MDKDTRNKLQNASQAARQLLTREYQEQLEGVFDVHPDGAISATPGGHLDASQKLVRQKIVSAIAHEQAKSGDAASAVQAYLREAAFTTLNRFVAFKMLEARRLLQPCVSQGEESAGFKEFCGLAPGLLSLADHGYQLYLECLCDEIGTEVKILFDRDDSASLLFPTRQALLELLAILNQQELASVWCEDETIGWVYQYFNSQEERREMREHAAPRNSHELAVRNQFFTPRYVVCFLSDNTLGRIWYEMRKANTKLKDLCQYLIRRPTEVFLKDGESVPEDQSGSKEDKTQEELLRQPVYIPHRKKKDPRDLKILDPACGSGHFLLYCFLLLLAIYEEAWADVESPASEATGKKLREDYTTIEDLRSAIPELILRHNLHGIDIDNRCAQIAALALWMRAQKAWVDLGIVRGQRPQVRKTNIVVAQPMPGEKAMLDEFIADHLNETPEARATVALLRKVFERMKLAGEAGSLLKIEEDIKEDIEQARKAWSEGKSLFESEQLSLVKDIGKAKQERFHFEFSGVKEGIFWDQAEQRIYAMLGRYSEQARNGRRYQRRLFTEDAALGFAFIDLCRKRYDVVLMNPPFGEACKGAKPYLAKAFPRTKDDLFAVFVERWLFRLLNRSRLGAITSRTGFFLSTFQRWREEILLSSAHPVVLADLGGGVLDSAMVETAAYVLEDEPKSVPMLCFRLLSDEDKCAGLETVLDSLQSDEKSSGLYLVYPEEFKKVGGSPFAYWISHRIRKVFLELPQFETEGRVAQQGLATSADFRFLRLTWEVPPARKGTQWFPYAKGGEFSPYYADLHLLVNWGHSGEEIKREVDRKYSHIKGYQTFWVVKNPDSYFRPGITWPRRTNGLSFRLMPRGCVFADKGSAAFLPGDDLSTALATTALLNSSCFGLLVSAQLARVELAQSYEVGLIQQTPFPVMDSDSARQLSDLANQAWTKKRMLDTAELTSHAGALPALLMASGADLPSRTSSWRDRVAKTANELVQIQSAVDSIALHLYNLNSSDIDGAVDRKQSSNSEDNSVPEPCSGEGDDLCSKLVDYLLGCIFGRWDVRYATGEKTLPALPDPFTPLPVCPPGMLQDAEGLPCGSKDVPCDYPIQVKWHGILVDDFGHSEDIETGIREVLKVIWKTSAEDIFRQAIDILDKGAPDLRGWLRRCFFEQHIRMHSKSRRKAPIYWCLCSSSGNYSVWLYYHRFNKDTLYNALNDYVKPRVTHEERRLSRWRQDAGRSPTSTQRKALGDQEDLVEELKLFTAELARVAPLWNPDLNDGVIVNFAPLWRLVSLRSWQKECKDCWDRLVSGEYDWAHLAMHLWPERVVPKCATDRSLAIAHGLESFFWEEKDGDWKPIKRKKDEVEALIAERTFPAVKAALEDLLNAPMPGGGARKRKAK